MMMAIHRTVAGMITKQTSSACQNQSIGDLLPSVEGYARWSIIAGN
jgi:hypothetical protein